MCVWKVEPSERLCYLCSVNGCKDRGESENVSAYGELRRMDASTYLFLPINKWNAARSAAALLKRDFGSKYEVHKLGNKVIVLRES